MKCDQVRILPLRGTGFGRNSFSCIRVRAFGAEFAVARLGGRGFLHEWPITLASEEASYKLVNK